MSELTFKVGLKFDEVFMRETHDSQPVDLTKLYIVSVLKDEGSYYLPIQEGVVDFERIEQIVDDIAEAVPPQHRVIQAVDTCPKQSMSLIDEDKKQALKQVLSDVYKKERLGHTDD